MVGYFYSDFLKGLLEGLKISIEMEILSFVKYIFNMKLEHDRLK